MRNTLGAKYGEFNGTLMQQYFCTTLHHITLTNKLPSQGQWCLPKDAALLYYVLSFDSCFHFSSASSTSFT
eukprot:10001427-Ditylum_brightwellii.AAC.1